MPQEPLSLGSTVRDAPTWYTLFKPHPQGTGTATEGFPTKGKTGKPNSLLTAVYTEPPLSSRLCKLRTQAWARVRVAMRVFLSCLVSACLLYLHVSFGSWPMSLTTSWLPHKTLSQFKALQWLLNTLNTTPRPEDPEKPNLNHTACRSILTLLSYTLRILPAWPAPSVLPLTLVNIYTGNSCLPKTRVRRLPP